MNIRIKALLVTALVMLTGNVLQGQAGQERVYLVWLEVQRPSDVAHCYTERFDRQRVVLDIPIDDPLVDLADYAFGAEEMEGPDCFIPELKLIYRNYTYIVSLYCTKVIKYQNASPFTPSNRRVKSDLLISEDVYTYLSDLRVRHFGRQSISSGLLSQITTGEPLENLTEADIDLDALLNEETLDPLDAELEKDTRDNAIILEELPEGEWEAEPDDGK